MQNIAESYVCFFLDSSHPESLLIANVLSAVPKEEPLEAFVFAGAISAADIEQAQVDELPKLFKIVQRRKAEQREPAILKVPVFQTQAVFHRGASNVMRRALKSMDVPIVELDGLFGEGRNLEQDVVEVLRSAGFSVDPGTLSALPKIGERQLRAFAEKSSDERKAILRACAERKGAAMVAALVPHGAMPPPVVARQFSTGRSERCDSDEPSLRLEVRSGGLSITAPDFSSHGITLSLFSSPDSRGFDVATVRPTAFRLTIGPARCSETHLDEGSRAIAGKVLSALRSRNLSVFQYVHDDRAVFEVEALAGMEAATEDIISDAADALLNALLIGARPVARWHTSFTTAFRDPDNTLRLGFTKSIASGKSARASVMRLDPNSSEARGYFLPEVIDTLFPAATDDDAAKAPVDTFLSYEFAIPAMLALQVDCGNYEEPLKARITNLRVHFLPGDTFLLEWITSGDNELASLAAVDDTTGDGKLAGCVALSGSNAVLWRHYLGRKDHRDIDGSGFTFAQLQDFNAEASLLFYDYFRTTVDRYQNRRAMKVTLLESGAPIASVVFGGKDGDLNRFEVGGIVEWLLGYCFRDEALAYSQRSPEQIEILRPLLAQYATEEWRNRDLAILGLQQLTDNRAKVITSLILDGGQVPSEAGERLKPHLARLSSVDPYGTSMPYDDEFSEKEFQAAAYKRFWSWGTHYLITDHSLVFAGSRHHPGIHDDRGTNPHRVPRMSFAEEKIHGKHMAGPYPRLYRVYLAIEASMRSIATQLAQLERRAPAQRQPMSGDIFERILDLRHDLDTLSGRIMLSDFSSQIQGHELTDLMLRQFRSQTTWKELDERLKVFENRWARTRELKEKAHLNAFRLGGVFLAVILSAKALVPQGKEFWPITPLKAWLSSASHGNEFNLSLLAGAMALAAFLFAYELANAIGSYQASERRSSPSWLSRLDEMTVAIAGYLVRSWPTWIAVALTLVVTGVK